ncbi:MAG: minor capsid protein [Candidatus Avilachnospira sp.]|jgi:SPP1 gp7 family putative phage head morphogenesis protein
MTYWEKRQLQKYQSGEKLILDYYKELEQAFEQARREVREVIDAFYGRYAKENKISYTDALKRLSNAETGDLKAFIERVNATMGTYDLELTNMSIKARVTRYEALEKEIDAILQRLYAVDYEKFGTQNLGEAYEEAYYRTWWSMDTGRGIHSAFSAVDPHTIDQLIKYPFNGSAFSDRLWKQKDYLLSQLMESLTTMFIQGKHPRTLAKDFAKKFESRKFDAYRLLHTEYSYISEEASQAVYGEDGIEEYEYMATLDSKTCGICGDLDGKKIKVKMGVIGQNKPPMHPLCRCTTAPWIEGLSGGGNRIARDENGKNIEVPKEMTYNEWRDIYIDKPKESRYNEIKRRVHKLINEEYPLKLNKGMQDKHISGSSNFDPKRSELTADPEELIRLYAGKSEIRTAKSDEWNHKEFFEHTDIIGIWRNEDGEEMPTKRGIFHYSKKKGIHIVPSNPEKR